MTSIAVSGSFERRSGVAHQQHSSIPSVHLAGRQPLSSSYSSTSMPTTAQPAAPFEGIVDFSYHPAHFAGFNPSPSDSSLQHHHASSASRVDGSEWKQSSFFSYRPNEVKHRKRTTRQQLKVLEETFRSTQKPDGNVRKSLALQLNMTPRNVQVWFQNRRAKDKTLAKRALRSVEDVRSGLPASSADNDSEAVASPRSEQDFRARYGASTETHSGSSSPIESVFPTVYEVPTPVYVTNDLAGVVSPSSSSYSQSDLGQVHPSAYQPSSSFGSETSAGTQFPAAYAVRDIYAPRASLPHIHAAAFQQDSQHQRSSSSPTFPCNVDTSSNLSLTTYASINGVLYPQQQQRFANAAPQSMYAQRNPVGPLPAADFTFGMNADAEADTELTGYASYSHFGSVSGSDTPSSVGGLSHYSSVASLAESARSFDEDGAPFNWKAEQRRGSIPLGIRPAFGGLVGRGFSPMSVGYSSNSPCPGAEAAEQESDGAENAIYMASRSLKMEGIDSNQSLGYSQTAFGFNGGVDQDASHIGSTEAYQQYMNYGQQQTVADNMLNYSYAPVQPEIQMPQPSAYSGYRFA